MKKKAVYNVKVKTGILLFLLFSNLIYAYDFNCPKIEKKYAENGIEISLKDFNFEDKTVYYRLYQPFYKTFAEGKFSKESFYIPYGAEICIWAKDQTGHLSSVTHFIAKKIIKNKAMQVLSPKKGIWNKKQYLVINSDSDVQIMYSADGSDPAQFGLLYTDPVLLDMEGEVDLWIKAISDSGIVDEKKIRYSVSPEGDFSKGYEAPHFEHPQNNPFKILNWYFAEFDTDEPIRYTIQSSQKKEPASSDITNVYDGPIFIERDFDTILYWIKSDDTSGIVHKIDLPKKPLISGVPEKPVNKSIELSFDDLRYTYFFENLEEISANDNLESAFQFENGKKQFDCKPAEEKKIDLNIKAFHNGLFHGEIYAEFSIDKKPPEMPKIFFTPSYSQSSKPVKVTVAKSNDENIKLIAEINPPVYTEKNGEFILMGETGEKTSYSVTFYNEDTAGNKSIPVKKELTVDRNSVYVDTGAVRKNADGSPSNPFHCIYDAVQFINRNSSANKSSLNTVNEKWKIYLRGNCVLNEAVFISRNIKIVSSGKRPSLRFAKNTGFIVTASYFELDGCDITRIESPDEPRDVPVIYGINSTIKINNVKIHGVEGGNLLRILHSHLSAADLDIISEQTESCIIFNIHNSSAVLQNINFTGKGFSAAAISASASNIDMSGIKCTLAPVFTARVIEAWNSEIMLGNLTCIRLPEDEKNKDTAVWYNKKSEIKVMMPPISRGFYKTIGQEP